jgi:hypothetical protein
MVRKLIRNQHRNQHSSSNTCDSAQPATHVLPDPVDSSLIAIIQNWESISEPTKQMILKFIRLDRLDQSETDGKPTVRTTPTVGTPEG